MTNWVSSLKIRQFWIGYPDGLSHTKVFNKIDLSGRTSSQPVEDPDNSVALSAKTGAGLAALRDHLKQVIGFQPQGEGGFSARRRHLDALQRAQAHVTAGQQQIEQHKAGELLAEELRLAQHCLSEINRANSAVTILLGEIFSSFCIGK